MQDHSRCQLQDTKVLLGTLEEAVEAMKVNRLQHDDKMTMTV